MPRRCRIEVPGMFTSCGRDPAFIARMHTVFPGYKALKVNTTCWDHMFNSASPDRDRSKQEEEILLYTWTKKLVLDDTKKQED